jgi:hypothetical protein
VASYHAISGRKKLSKLVASLKYPNCKFNT